MSAGIGKREAEFASQLAKVREDFEVEREGLNRSIISITAANENSKKLKKESAEARVRNWMIVVASVEHTPQTRLFLPLRRFAPNPSSLVARLAAGCRNGELVQGQEPERGEL